MFGYGKSDYEKFSNTIEEAYSRYDDLKLSKYDKKINKIYSFCL